MLYKTCDKAVNTIKLFILTSKWVLPILYTGKNGIFNVLTPFFIINLEKSAKNNLHRHQISPG